jgi:O-antigen/teichoic acid export membrane protein
MRPCRSEALIAGQRKEKKRKSPPTAYRDDCQSTMDRTPTKSALSSPVTASIAAMAGRFLLLGTGALTGIMIPLSMSQHHVGLFFLTQSLIAALATIGQLGLSITSPALISNSLGRHDNGRVRQIINRSIVLGIGGASLLAILFWLISSSFAYIQGWPLGGAIHEVAPIIAVSLIFAALATILTEQHRAVGHFVQASFLATGASLASAATVVFAWITHSSLPLSHLLIAGAIGSGIGALVGATTMRRWSSKSQAIPNDPVGYGELIRQTKPNLTTTIVLFIVAQADLWIIAAFSDTAGLAIYGLASRLAGLTLIPLAVVNTVVAPSIGRLWARQKPRYLQRTLGIGSGAATSLAVIGYVLFLLCGKFLLLNIWSADYLNAYYIFMILGASLIIQTYAGTAGFVLMMLGRQDIAMRISVGAGLLMIVGGAIAMADYGIIGLAIAYSFGGMMQSILMIYMVKKLFNLTTTADYRALAKFSRLYIRKRT